MPHNCYDCDIHNYHECSLTSESIEEDYCWNGDSREKHCPLREVEAIPKADYENRLKADLKAILVELQFEIEELDSRAGYSGDGMPTFSTDYIRKKKVNELVQQKISALKKNEDGKESSN